MFEYLPKDLQDGLDAARKRAEKRKGRLCIHIDGQVHPIRRWWEGGFALSARHAPSLRGLVDVYDGPKHIFRCLVIASQSDEEEVICEFKRSTAPADRAALDFCPEAEAPAGLLPRF